MIKKRGKKSLINNGDKVEKTKKEDKKINNVDKLLEKITTDTVIDAMVVHKWLVAKTIAAYIIGASAWGKLSEDDQYIIIKRVNEIKLLTPGLM